MDKNTFLKYFKEEDIATKLYNRYMLAVNKNITVFSKEFLSPHDWGRLLEMENKLHVKIFTEGIFEESERRMVAFGNLEEKPEFPIEIIKIKGKSKFHNLKHKDFLGAVMAQGLEREKMGDFIVEDNSCYFPILEDMSSYIKYSLDSVGKSPCDVITIYDLEDIPKKQYEEKVIVVSSLRLDNIVSNICNLSRSKAEDIISQGKVLVNYYEISKKDKILESNDKVIVRGFGKFILKDILGITSKDKYRVLIQKYI